MNNRDELARQALLEVDLLFLYLVLLNLNGTSMRRASRPLKSICRRPRASPWRRGLLTESYARGPSNPPLLEQTVGEHFASVVAKYGDRTAFAALLLRGLEHSLIHHAESSPATSVHASPTMSSTGRAALWGLACFAEA